MSDFRRAYSTPVFSPSDPLVCHELTLRPSLWAVVFNTLQQLGEDWSWRQDDPASATVEEVTDEVNKASDAAIFRGCTMLGDIHIIARDPASWELVCDGTVYENADYPDLAAVINPAYIVDATHFRVPDFMDRFMLGSLIVGVSGGESSHVISVAELPPHAHAQDQFGVAASTVLGELPGFEIAPTPGNTGTTGGGAAMPIMPPFETVAIVIMARYPDGT